MHKVNRRSRLAVLVIVIIALIGVLAINTDPARAVKSSAPQTTDEAQVTGNGAGETSFYSSAMPSLLKLFSALVVVVAAIYVGIFLLKRLMGKKYSGNRQSNLLEVIETTYIAPKKSVSLLRVADKSVLIGTSENQITVLTELDSEETRRVLAAAATEVESENFGHLLKHATSKIREFGFRRAGKTALETQETTV
ncbi:MAG: flagellar biosynthetic protein FliO [Candidatus Zixiibacteriota bacterium]